MNLIILLSHGELALGMKHTASIIIGDTENIIAFSAYGSQDLPIKENVIKVIKQYYLSKNIFIVTDILGGSVNTEALQLTNDYPDITVLAGMNLSLVISLATKTEPMSKVELEQVISESREGIINCSMLMKEIEMEESDL